MIINITGKNILKSKGFCPNPVAKYGIPEYADSVSFPQVWGTPDWENWWNEQITYCFEGYTTGGTWIPGRYYYYLNFAYMNTVGRGFHHPDFVDTDLDFFLLVEYVKAEKKGIISIKARRRGLSFKTNKGVIEYGTKFLGPKYMGGICAGVKQYAEDFAIKLTDTQAITAPELSLNTLKINEDQILYGYEQADQQNKFVKTGSLNEVYIRTAFQSANVFKGTQLEDCIFEESGEFLKLMETYEATKWCFMDGEQMVGTPYIYGTGGKMLSSSKAFAEMFSNASAYNLEKFWIPGTKIYKPCYKGCTNTYGESYSETPNIDAQHGGKDETRTLGMEDEKEALRQILLKRDLLTKAKNKKALQDHIQNNPISIEEAFLSSADNNYNAEILHSRTLELLRNHDLYNNVVFEPKKDEFGQIIMPIEVVIRPAVMDETSHDKDPDWKIVQLYKWPAKQRDIQFLDSVGIDGYDQDQSATSKSLGAVMAYRQSHSGLDLRDNYYGPVCMYYKRPPRKEQFYLVAGLISLAYCDPNMSLIDAGSPMIIDWFIRNNLEHLLANRPKSLESPNSEQNHTYGMKFTVWNRPQLESLVQTEIEDNAHRWPFIDLCKDCSGYNTGDNENDADAHDALMLAKAVFYDRKLTATKKTDVNKNSEPTMREDAEGNVYYTDNSEIDTAYGGDLFMQQLQLGYHRQ